MCRRHAYTDAGGITHRGVSGHSFAHPVGSGRPDGHVLAYAETAYRLGQILLKILGRKVTDQDDHTVAAPEEFLGEERFRIIQGTGRKTGGGPRLGVNVVRVHEAVQNVGPQH